MSYCRGPDSDVYVYGDGEGYNIHLSGGHISFRFKTRRGLYNRLLKLKAAGIRVPKRAFDRLRRELILQVTQEVKHETE